MARSLINDISIRHQVRGRLRLKINKVFYKPVIAYRIEEGINQLDGIKTTRMNTNCASLIIFYDVRKLSVDTILKEVRGLTKTAHLSEASTRSSIECCSYEKLNNQSTIRKFGTFILLSGYMVYVHVKQFFFRVPILQTPFSTVSIVSTVAALPMIRNAWREAVYEHKFTINQFLSFALLTTIFTGNALTALEIIFILRGGMLLEEFVAERSRKAIRKILEISVKNTYILVDGKEKETHALKVKIGDTVVAHTGEKIPVDGRVLQGDAFLDESLITGRSEPVLKQKDDQVYAGTIVSRGVLYIHAEKVGSETYMARVLKMVEDSLGNRAPVQNVADELARKLSILGVSVTFLTFLLTRSLSRTLTVMIVMSCPCATVLAASTAITSAIYSAARRRILVKGGIHIEHMAHAKVYCFDKTGTITTDEPTVSKVIIKDNGISEKDLFKWAALAEMHNQHPLAAAIHKRAEELDVISQTHRVCEFFPGRGVRSEVDGKEILVGNLSMMKRYGIDNEYYQNKAAELIENAQTVIYVAKDGDILGLIGVTNSIRPETQRVIKQLKDDDVNKIILITGDNEPVARKLSQTLNFDSYYANLLPDDKGNRVKEIQSTGEKVVMVGDGVNDTLALSISEVGIAMGAGGSDVAIEVADITLATDELDQILYLRTLSKKTLKVVHQNYWLAVGTNLTGVCLGAVGLLNPVMGGILHMVHTLGIMANSTRILRS